MTEWMCRMTSQQGLRLPLQSICCSRRALSTCRRLRCLKSADVVIMGDLHLKDEVMEAFHDARSQMQVLIRDCCTITSRTKFALEHGTAVDLCYQLLRYCVCRRYWPNMVVRRSGPCSWGMWALAPPAGLPTPLTKLKSFSTVSTCSIELSLVRHIFYRGFF